VTKTTEMIEGIVGVSLGVIVALVYLLSPPQAKEYMGNAALFLFGGTLTVLFVALCFFDRIWLAEPIVAIRAFELTASLGLMLLGAERFIDDWRRHH